MAVATKLTTKVVLCEHCNCENEISAQNLKKSGDNRCGRYRYLRYVCKRCGKINSIYSREVPLPILRQMNEI